MFHFIKKLPNMNFVDNCVFFIPK